MSAPISNVRPDPDQVLVDIADYVLNYEIQSGLAYETARNCLIDTCLLYTSPSPRDLSTSRMPSSA